MEPPLGRIPEDDLVEELQNHTQNLLGDDATSSTAIYQCRHANPSKVQNRAAQVFSKGVLSRWMAQRACWAGRGDIDTSLPHPGQIRRPLGRLCEVAQHAESRGGEQIDRVRALELKVARGRLDEVHLRRLQEVVVSNGAAL